MATEGEDPGFRVTTRDVYNIVMEIKQALAPLSQLPDSSRDHELRLRVVEQRKTVSPAVLWTAITSAMSALLAILDSFGALNTA
jgi:hypothetical protein